MDGCIRITHQFGKHSGAIAEMFPVVNGDRCNCYHNLMHSTQKERTSFL